MTTTDFQKACQYIPGGVNSPARSFKSIGGEPIFIDSAEGPYMVDTQGRRYIDYVGSWGPMILGHNPPKVKTAIDNALEKGTSFGAPCEQETQLAAQLCELVPSLEKVRLVNSGTEATMSALRVARAATGRQKILKFEGCYHGHHDGLLVKAGSGALTLGQPSSPGVPEGFTQYTLVAPFNQLDAVEAIFETHGNEIAAVIVEPVAGNMGCIPPQAGFLEGLRVLCDHYQSLLIFDEVMTGFRVALGGAQQYYEVTPDLTTLGKIIGGGLPVGAFGGRADVMDQLAPLGPVYQAGTLSGNPLAMAAGLATLEGITRDPEFYQTLDQNCTYLAQSIRQAAASHDVPIVVNHIGGMLSIFFTQLPQVTTFSEVQQTDVQKFTQFFHSLLDQGIYWPPSAFESAFISAKHGIPLLEQTTQAIEATFAN